MLIALAAAVAVKLSSLTVTGLLHPAVPPPGAPLLRYYPEHAQSLGITGEATIRCRLKEADRTLADCRVVNEAPRNEGFGDKAKEIATAHYRVPDSAIKAIKATGSRPEGSEADLSIYFVLKDDSVRAKTTPDAGGQGAAPDPGRPATRPS